MSRANVFLPVILLLSLSLALPTTAASDDPEIIIEWPNEDETLYAGPSSLLYSIPIKGYVEGSVDNEGVVQLEVLQEGWIASRYTVPVEEDRFEFLATVNPHGSDGRFPSEHLTCADDCHLPGSFALPAGELTLHISLLVDGRPLTTAERNIVIDLGRPATIPVEVRLADNPQQIVRGVRVVGSTRLYLWRARHFLAQNEEDGPTLLEVEALSEASTDYLVRVRPTVIDGVLYEAVDESIVHLPAGATTTDLVTLHVRGHRGKVTGRVSGFPEDSDAPCTIYAIALPDGNAIHTDVNADGSFAFLDLPIDQYRIVLDQTWLAREGWRSIWHDVNLTASHEEVIRLPLTKVTRQLLEGQIVEESGQPLPFTWIDVAGTDGAHSGHIDGRFRASTNEISRSTLIARAPGYYSRAQVITNEDRDIGTLSLTEQPNMRSLPWGDGRLLLPPESSVEVNKRNLFLTYGWLWGQGARAEPYRISVGDITIELSHGRFALEHFPADQSWLYLLEGEATVHDSETGTLLTVGPQQMVNLQNEEGLKAAPYDPTVVASLGGTRRELSRDVWEPSVRAVLRDRLALLGVGTARLITFITYGFILLSLGGSPFVVLYYLRHRSRKNQKSAQP